MGKINEKNTSGTSTTEKQGEHSIANHTDSTIQSMDGQNQVPSYILFFSFKKINF